MPLKDYLFTSESVSEGHPDKICDQISDTILDAYLKLDRKAKVAAECAVHPDGIMIFGEIGSKASISNEELEKLVRGKIKEIGYEQERFHWEKIEVDIKLNKQSPDIAMGVVDNEIGHEEGAGDQGIMFGFACNETEEYMPAPLYYSHKILHELSDARKSGEITKLGPDAKSQVTLEYQDDRPVKATSIVVSIQHTPDLNQQDVRSIIMPHIEKVLPSGWIDSETILYVNPTGKFTIGGPESDAGLTGRKIIVDTYGGAAPHGGGAFSGKDASKVDRSAAYAARYLAKNAVAAGLANRCAIQIAYAIGVAEPLAFYINTYETGKIPEGRLAKALRECINLTPKGIRDHLQLDRPIYARTATYGHFGRKPQADGGFSWEKLDLVDKLKTLL